LQSTTRLFTQEVEMLLFTLCWWQTVQVSRTSFSYEKLGTRNWSVCHKFSYEFFSYEKLGWIRTMFYSVRETWSHV